MKARHRLAVQDDEEPDPTYQSYLVRLWRATPTVAWRASLYSLATGQIQSFATLDLLLDFLYRLALPVCGDEPPGEEPPREEEPLCHNRDPPP